MEYTSGDLVVAAGPDVVVVLGPSEMSAQRVGGLWDRVEEPLSARTPLRELVGPEGPFDLSFVDHAAVVRPAEHGLEALLKGSLAMASEDDPRGREPWPEARGAWREEAFQGPGAVVLAQPHRPLVDPLWLPLRFGVVHAAAVRWSTVAVSSDATGGGHFTAGAAQPTDRAAERSVSHRLLFGERPRSLEGPGARQHDESRPGRAQVTTSAVRPALDRDAAQATLPPPDVDSPTSQPEVPPAPETTPEPTKSAMLPPMPREWVQRRTGRRGSESGGAAAPPGGPGARAVGPTPFPSPSRTGRGPAFLTRVASPDLARTGLDLPPRGGRAASADAGPPVPSPPELLPASGAAAEVAAGHTVLHRSGATPLGDDVVVVVRCPDDHVNPPHATSCRVCGHEVTDRHPIQVQRPQLGRLCTPGLPDRPIVGPMLLGRRPEWPGPPPSPDLVTIPDPEQSISRSHLAVSVSGWDVSVTDLGSSNGTRLDLPDGQNLTLVPHRPVVIVPSTTIVLADVVQIWFQVP